MPAAASGQHLAGTPKDCTAAPDECTEYPPDDDTIKQQTVDENVVPCKKIDLVLVLDASGSLGAKGWEYSKAAAKKMVEMLDLGKAGVNAGFVKFASKVQLISPLTDNKKDLLAKVDALTWSRTRTNTT